MKATLQLSTTVKLSVAELFELTKQLTQSQKRYAQDEACC